VLDVPVARAIDYESDEEHILRRLGGAVVLLWPDLPSDVQETILAQAPLIRDRVRMAQLHQEIVRFISRHTS
jgi:hypothetical protein